MNILISIKKKYDLIYLNNILVLGRMIDLLKKTYTYIYIRRRVRLKVSKIRGIYLMEILSIHNFLYLSQITNNTKADCYD